MDRDEEKRLQAEIERMQEKLLALRHRGGSPEMTPRATESPSQSRRGQTTNPQNSAPAALISPSVRRQADEPMPVPNFAPNARLLIIANRLPVSMCRAAKDTSTGDKVVMPSTTAAPAKPQSQLAPSLRPDGDKAVNNSSNKNANAVNSERKVLTGPQPKDSGTAKTVTTAPVCIEESHRPESGGVVNKPKKKGSEKASATKKEKKDDKEKEKVLTPKKGSSEDKDKDKEKGKEKVSTPKKGNSEDKEKEKEKGKEKILATKKEDNEDKDKGKEKEKEKEKEENWTFKVSSGGLVSALKGLKDLEMVWIGWPGTPVLEQEEKEITGKLRAQKMVPVFISKEEEDLYYSGFSNGILWPLFHYFPPDIEVIQGASGWFEAYEAVNNKFADVVLEEYKDGDVVWVQDYHLMLLPSILRARKPMIKVGFFLHTPFPSSELYKCLPWREELLNGLLSADLIGFHTHDYARHFQSACATVLGLSGTNSTGEGARVLQGIDIGGGFAATGAFPIGIDPVVFIEALRKPAVKGYVDELKARFRGKKVLLGIDRLDYTKGIPHKLYAMERFLELYPSWIGNVVLVQIAVPSRSDVKEYQRLSRQVHELVGRINGRFGTLTSVPIHFLDQSIPFDRMCALYHVAEAAVCSSIRDGMNLVAYEYIVCQEGNPKPGVLILSEFTGAAQSLGAGAISVNPWDVTELAEAMNYALTLSESERMEHWTYASQHVHKYTAEYWAHTFLEALNETSDAVNTPVVPPRMNIEEVAEKFKQAKNRVIISGVVGTLTQKNLKGTDKNRYQAFSRSSAKLHYLVNRLAIDPNTTFVALSSRTRGLSQDIIGETEAWLSAENGFYLRRGGKDRDWEEPFGNVDLSWMNGVEAVLNHWTERTPRSFMERKETYLSWHYHDCDPQFGDKQARLLHDNLVGQLTNAPASVIRHHKIIQIRPAAVTKSLAAERILNEIEIEKGPIDFILCVGNFLREEEDLFTACNIPATLRCRTKSISTSSPMLPENGRRPRGSVGMGLEQRLGSGSRRSSFSGHGATRSEPDLNAPLKGVPSGEGKVVYTATVGKKQSHAKAYLDSSRDVQLLFERLAGLPMEPRENSSAGSMPNTPALTSLKARVGSQDMDNDFQPLKSASVPDRLYLAGQGDEEDGF